MSAYLSLKYSEENRVFVFKDIEHELQLHQVQTENKGNENYFTVGLRDGDGVEYTMVAVAEQLVGFRDDHPACLEEVKKFMGDLPILEGFVVVVR